MTTVTVDQQLMARLMRQIELTANRRGWDQPPNLYVLYGWRDHDAERHYRELMPQTGEVVRCGPYAARPIVRSELLTGSPHHALFRMALNLTRSDHPQVRQFADATSHAGFLGAAFAHEAWTRTYNNPQERADEGDVRFADMPGSTESRFVLAADVAGGTHWVMRYRGSKPQTDGGDEHGGALVESLRAITARISGQPVPEIVNVPTGWDWSNPEAEN